MEIYVCATIIDFGNGDKDCRLVQQVGDEPMEVTQLDELHTNKLMWELVKAGGCRDYSVNWLNRSIVTHSAYIFLPG